MSIFISEKAQKIIKLHSSNLDEISIIIPNKRAAIYIQASLAECISTPFFSPEIITINEWINQLTPEKILNQHELVFLLFEIHCQIQNTPEDFNEFLKWANTLLADFDEIDRYLISPEKLFMNLRNIKEIEHWSFNDPELTEGQEKYLHFWNQLPLYYKKLNELLDSRNLTYQGKSYKKIAENIHTIATSKKHYYFFGFNALSASEEKIIHTLIKEKKATFETEIDLSYFRNSGHEAGFFYRKLCEKWHLTPQTVSVFDQSPKSFEIIETAQQIGQCKIAGQLVQKLIVEKSNLNSTAIVLADESLLIPLMQSLPNFAETVNITMGYPLKNSHLKSLIDLVFDLQFNFQKFKNSALYHKSILRVLDHSYIAELITDQTKIVALEKYIVERNLVFIDWVLVVQYLPELTLVSDVFKLWKNYADDGFEAMNKLVECLYNSFQNKKNKALELETLYHFSISYKKFESIWKPYKYELDLKTYKRLFYQFWQGEVLSFVGNPIAGIQVMGILETRLLDFENLIILGMNEGNLPQTNLSTSFIPYDLKRHHHLPTEEDRQAIFAHHFYRLLHHAKNIYITYNSGADDGGNSEKSRYITQLENQLDYSKGHRIKHQTYSPDDRTSILTHIQYASTKEVHKKLDDYFEKKGLSPSALNKLINCPLDFYYRYILEMKENKQLEESIESSTFGTKIHDVLEDLFRRNFLDTKQPLNVAILKQEKKYLEKYLKEKYLEQDKFRESELRYGQNRLSFEISLEFLNKFIDSQCDEIEKSDQPIFIKELEKNLELTIEIHIEGITKKILLSGLADRIDQVGNLIRIVDYKSGKCDSEKVVIPESYIVKNEMYKLLNHDKKGYARQLLMYALMYRANHPEHNCFSAGIISMINLREWLQNVRIGNEGESILSNSILDQFQHELKSRIELLYSPDFIFEHNPDSKYCEHCDN